MKLKSVLFFVILWIMFVVFPSCGAFTHPKTKPIIEDHTGNLGILATTAQRRVVITKKDYLKDEHNKPLTMKELGIWHGGHYESKFCAEPPPDVADSLLSSFQMLLEGSAEGLKEKPEISLEIAKTLRSTAKSLFTRSQGVQLFRDGAYSLCQAYLNGAINEEEYDRNFEILMNKASLLVSMEVQKLPDVNTQKAEAAAEEAVEAQNAAENAAAKIEKIIADQTKATSPD